MEYIIVKANSACFSGPYVLSMSVSLVDLSYYLIFLYLKIIINTCKNETDQLIYSLENDVYIS